MKSHLRIKFADQELKYDIDLQEMLKRLPPGYLRGILNILTREPILLKEMSERCGYTRPDNFRACLQKDLLKYFKQDEYKKLLEEK